MTVLATESSSLFPGSGNNGPFTWTWRFLDNSHINVIKIVDDVEYPLVEGGDYILTGAGSYQGGSITLVQNLPPGETLYVERNTDLLQDLDLRNQGDFFPDSYEDALDKKAMVQQDRQRQVERSIKMPLSATGNFTLPSGPRAGMVLGFGPDGAPSFYSPTEIVYLDTVKTYVEVYKFGAVGDGVTDDAAAIRAADAYAESINAVLLFKGKSYLVNSELKISCPWFGVAGKTQVIFGTGFVRTAVYADPLSYAYVWNKNFSRAGYTAGGDFVFVDGIEFRLEKEAGLSTTMMLGNVRGGSITNCKFDHDGVSTVVNNLDLHASVKNLLIEGNEFRNETTANAGGNIWVRNMTTDAANAASATENITIRHNTFFKDSGDESIAVTSVFSQVKNVRVENNRFSAVGTVQGALLVAGLDPNPAYVATAECRDVQFNNNHIVTSATTNEVLRAGVAGDNSDKLNDIIFQGNTILYDAPNTGTRAAIRQVAGHNVKAIGNSIYNVGTAYAVQRGVYGMDEARDNTIKDVPGCAAPMVTAVDACTLAVNNIIDNGGTGLQNVNYSSGNRVKAFAPFSVLATGQFDADNNHFEIAGTGVFRIAIIFNSLGGTVAPSGRLRGNTIVCGDAANHRSVLVQGTGRVGMVNNIIMGLGKYVSGPLAYAKGNDWFGVMFDDLHTTSVINEDLLASLPYGHKISNSTALQSPDVNGNLLAGWVKAKGPGVAGGELSAFGAFGAGADAAWQKEAGWTVASLQADFNGADGKAIYQNQNGIAGDDYDVTYTVVSVPSGGFKARVGGTLGTLRNAPGTYTERITAGAAALAYGVVSVGATVGAITNFSIKHVDYPAMLPVYHKTTSP